MGQRADDRTRSPVTKIVMTTSTFAADIRKFVEKTKISMDVIIRKVALDAFRGVMMMSPVDTGRFRGNWNVGINRINSRVFTPQEGPVQPSGALPTPGDIGLSGAGDLNKAKITDVIYITNNLPYAIPLEYGHSKQAPNGVLGVTFERVISNLRSAVNAVA